MTNSKLKKQIRERQAKTGEPYQVAHRILTQGGQPAAENPASLESSSGGAESSVERPQNFQHLSPADQKAFEALHDYAREAVVFLLDGQVGPGASTAGVGSGTLFKTPGGQIVVLSAAHVFDGVPDDGMSLGGKISGGVSNAVTSVQRHPTADVAVALLSEAAAAVFGRFAISSTLVARSSDTAFVQENPMVICGYPAAYRKTRFDRSRRLAHVELGCVSYLTMVDLQLDSRDRYRVTWKEAVLTEHDPVVPEVKPGEVFEIAHPRGISGGPLWRFRSLKEDELWAPAKKGSIVGVASTYLREDGIEFCPSVAAWGDWFRDVIVAIDASAPVFSREDVRRCVDVAPDLDSWAEGKIYEEEAQISYDRVNARAEKGAHAVVSRRYVRAIGVRLDDRPGWKISTRIDALWGGPEPESPAVLAKWLEEDLGVDRVLVRVFKGNVAEIDAFWFAKHSGFDRAAAEKLVTDMGLL